MKKGKTKGLLITLLIGIILLLGAYGYYVYTKALYKSDLIVTCIGAGIIAVLLVLTIFALASQIKADKRLAQAKAAKAKKKKAEEAEAEVEEVPQEAEVEEAEVAEVEEPQEVEETEVAEVEEANEEAEEEPAPVAEENAEVEEEPQAVEEEIKEAPVQEAPKAEELQPAIAAILKETEETNKNIENKLDKIDNSLKLIAKALTGLIYDAVPSGTVSVPVTEEQEEEPQNDYFDQVQEEPAPVAEQPAQEEEQEEQPEAEPVQEAPAQESDAEDGEEGEGEWVDTANEELRIKPKMSFDMRLRVADDDIKTFYSDIKNELLSYGIHDRISRHRENFNQGRINICRMVINGKTLKVYLAVDPESIDKRYFHHTDVGHRKGLIELPTMINVRSKVAARKVKELITLMMESLVISKKPYEPQDFAKELTLDGFTTVESKGYDYLVEKSMTLEKAKAYPDNFAAQLIEMVEDNQYQEKFIKTEVTLDDLAKNFKNGDVVDIAKVRELGLGAKNSNFLSVKESDKMATKLKVYANEYTPDAVKMICLSGGEAFLVVQPEEVVEEV